MRGDDPPIPSYDEAIAGRSTSSTSFLGPTEVSNDAEREGLLAGHDGGPGSMRGYRAPTVESARSSMDFLGEGRRSARNSDEGLRLEMEEMEVLDPPQQSQMSLLISKRISSLTSGLSSLNIPFREYFSSFRLSNIRLPPMPEEFKPSWILVIRIIGLLLVFGIGYLLFFSDMLHFGARGGFSVGIDQVSRHLFMHLNGSNIRENLRHATKFDHMAGTEGSYYLAKWFENEMNLAGWADVRIEQYDIYMNYPKKNGRSVAIIDPPTLAFTAKLEEETVYPDHPREQTAAFHAYSKSGNATGPLVYANFGSKDDFDYLERAGVKVQGAIVLVRYSGTQKSPAMKVRRAEEAGAVGCLIYSDPQQDGFVKGKEYPQGPERPKDGVQRDSVGMTPYIVGDPLSPGFSSQPEQKQRIPVEKNVALPKIPSIPLAWRDAQPLLAALKNQGKKLTDKNWIGGVPDVEWWTGGDRSPTVRLQNELEEAQRQPIFNVVGSIIGRESTNQAVVVGNHYDSWCFGATDPGSGTAVMVELIRKLGDLRQLGWQPRRSIVFGMWDGKEYNMAGSTEHVESRADGLHNSGIAYINVAGAVAGTDFRASGSPIMERALLSVMNRVVDPSTGNTLRAGWDAGGKHIEAPGGDGDYVAFQDIAGVSSLDVGFGGKHDLYHSCYDTFEYMDRYGDTSFEFHRAMAMVVGLLAVELADVELVPLDLEAYARAISGYLDELDREARTALSKSARPLDLGSLRAAHSTLQTRAASLGAFAQKWYQTYDAMGGFEGVPMMQDRMRYNSAAIAFEADLLDAQHGLPNRTQFHHVLFAPALGDSAASTGAVFPGVRDALLAGDAAGAQAEADRAAKVLLRAAEALPV